MRFGLVLTAVITLAGLLLLGASNGDRSDGPEQPIAFSHLQHAGELDMACEYCHSYARRSPVAGLPSVKRCMGCHDFVAYDADEVQKLVAYLDNEEPIPWSKVYTLPDHTKFFHDRHVRAEVGCSTCHGAVETMERVWRVNDFEMGWCVDCHLERQATVDCLACHH